MKKNVLAICILVGIVQVATAQTKPDTVVIELAKSSRVIFTVNDRSDLPILKEYDFQALFNDLIRRIEEKDSATTTTSATEQTVETSNDYNRGEYNENEEVDWGDEDRDDDWSSVRITHNRYRGSRHSFNFDLGVNNYLASQKFPDADQPYAVRPWGSWYLGFNSIQRSPIGNKFYIEWGLGMSWYNFKFEDNSILLTKDDNGLIFTPDTNPDRDYIKSKLTASYVNASFVPMLDFGGYHRKARIWESRGSGFRIGAGVYGGYRIGSHSKIKYKEDGNREKDKDKDNYYLNNLRYGVRVQVGLRSTDLFFNYDLNNLFTDKINNPSVNAISFGIIF